jgi:CRP/FNR family transcriptional regulator
MEDLRQITEFKSSPELVEKLYKYGIQKNYQSGSVILNENAPIRSIPIVTQGIHNETSKVRAEVEEDAEILFLPVDKVSLFIKEYPQWLDYIFRLYHKRFEELLEIVNAVSFKKVDERLLNLLKKKAELAQSKTIQTTHEQLANELGTARVVVSRLLKQLEENKILKLGRNKITLV